MSSVQAEESSTDNSFADLVRQVLPKPRPGEQWRVEIVDDIEGATANRSGEPVVRVHKAWRESIYDAGLAHVTRHYPLALELLGDQNDYLLLSAKGVTLWRGKAIRRVYWGGSFTGQLRLVPVTVARTHDGLGICAHHKAEFAARGALRERRSRLKQEALRKRHIEELRKRAHEILRRRIQSDRGYDSDYYVKLAPYKKLLPLAKFLARDADTAPLVVLENESVEAVLHMEWNNVLVLFNQLAFDFSAARGSLSREEESALEKFLATI